MSVSPAAIMRPGAAQISLITLQGDDGDDRVEVRRLRSQAGDQLMTGLPASMVSPHWPRRVKPLPPDLRCQPQMDQDAVAVVVVMT